MPWSEAYRRGRGRLALHERPTKLPSGKTAPPSSTRRTLGAMRRTATCRTLTGLKSADKRIPEFVWHAGLDVKQAFLQALFEGDGCVSYLGKNTVQISYSTRSEQLARDVQDLLLEFGVISRRAEYANGEIKLVIGNRRDANLFARRVGFWGAKQEKLEQILDALPGSLSTNDVDRIPFLAAVRAGRERRPRRRQEVAGEAQLRPHRRLGAPRPRDPGHIPSAEVQPGHRPAGLERLVLRHRRVGDRRRRAAGVLDPGRFRRSRLPRRRVRQPQHRVEAGAAGDAAAGRDRRGHRRLHAHLRRQHRRARRPSREISQPPGQRRRRDRRRYGDEHPAAQPRGGDRRGAAPARPPRRVGHRPHAVREGPRLPDGRARSSGAAGSTTPTRPVAAR